MDWNLGEYEYIAVQLEPAARAVVLACGEIESQRVLDIGCGTGNGALLAARRHARVLGVDPASRLLQVARERAASEGLDVDFASGAAEELPVPDASVDAAISVFGLIFTTEPAAAAREIRRVLAPTGKLVYSAWLPGSALASVRRDVITPALDEAPRAAPFAWHDPAEVGELFATSGLTATFREVGLKFVDASARAFVDGEWQNNPIWVAARHRLEANGRFDEVHELVVAHFETANEERSRFAVTSSFVVVTLAA